jgi:signal transduction histidine kinase
MLKNKILLSLIFSILFFITGFFVNSFYQNRKNDFIAKTAKLQENIIERETISTNILNSTFQDYNTSGINKLFSNDQLSEITIKNGISVFLFENDTLKYWSDNKVQIDNIFNGDFGQRKILLLNNGWYEINKKEAGNIKIINLILIKNEYGYENDYLANSLFDTEIKTGKVEISINKRRHNIFNQNGQFLFSVKYQKTNLPDDIDSIVVFILFLAGFIFFISFLYYLQLRIFKNSKNNIIAIAVFIAEVLILRTVIFYLKVPDQLFASKIFSPFFYANSEFLPSFGDLLINVIVLLIFSIVVYRNFAVDLERYKKNNTIFSAIVFFAILLTVIAFLGITYLMRSLIVDSTISFDLNNIFSISLISIIGFGIISTLLLSFYFLTANLINALFKKTLALIILTGTAIFLAFIVAIFFNNSIFLYLNFATVVLYILGLWLLKDRKQVSKSITRATYLIVLFSLFSTILLNNYNDFKENEKRKSLAQRLSSSNDFIAEYLYKGLEKKVLADKKLKQYLNDIEPDVDKIIDYVTAKYFNGYWDKYKVQITICRSNDSLTVQPNNQSVNCNEFFSGLIKSIGRPTADQNLSILNYETGGNSYIARLKIQNDSLSQTSLFIELNSKFIPKGLGYPELLIDKKIFINTDLSNYSYAKYKNSELIDAYGKYFYGIKEEQNKSDGENVSFYNSNGYNHLFYKIDDSNSIIISKKNGNVFEIVAVFSYLFFFYAFFVVLFIVISRIPHNKRIVLNFKNRLQLSMMSVIFLSFLLIGIATFFYIKKLNENKNNDALTEKTLSILTEIQNKIAEYESFNPEINNYLSGLLTKFSNVFFTDINFYDTNGDLISSSRPQIFAEGLVSYKMNTEAFNQIAINNKTFLIQKERIGKLEYYSAYIPFFNNQNKLVAYLNLPYFAKESDSKKELSSFLMAFINIYVLLIALTTIIALLISGRITRPLNIITSKIGSVKLGGKNEKIYWGKNDEIGSLINEYNRMIDEIALSAELLAKSERESAWRDMAKQVAHEIKNPLTPMKLSVQFLQKAWSEDKTDFGLRLERFTKTLIEQIESLATIASEFSDFANMPKPIMQQEDIIEIIKTSANLFKNSPLITFSIEYDRNKQFVISADKKQMIRVFNNLISNAVQAIGDKKDGIVKISAISSEISVIVSVYDNGCGISELQKPMIFTPKFSTKTTGMGLGLAMVKSIVETHEGKIWFNSEESIGTTFSLEFPK